jgi:hypothetical protein
VESVSIRYSMAEKINFTAALNILCDAMRGYKVIPRYSHRIPWSFKFEKGTKQYDPIDVLYMHLFQTKKAEAFHTEYNSLCKVGMTADTVIVLAQLSNGVFKKVRGPLREHYERRRAEFESRTGIKVG